MPMKKNYEMPKWFSDKIINLVSTKEHFVKSVKTSDYFACEYKLNLNIFSFGKISFYIPFTVIGPPLSIDESGFCGNINCLISDYKKRKGLFLMLNLKEKEVDIKSKVAIGQTLPSCIFTNKFESFDDYLFSLRSSYRRRIKIALKKGNNLTVKRIKSNEFNIDMYNLYLNVLKNSKFPLETLPFNFFKNCDCDIDVFYYENKPVAFVMTEDYNFIFGGMNYKYRDKFDLYYNMLIHILKIGIKNNVSTINFGQTAESSKCRIGCVLEKRYMVAFSGNKLLNHLLIIFAPFLQNKNKQTDFNVFN
jgi:hypothetical protein